MHLQTHVTERLTAGGVAHFIRADDLDEEANKNGVAVTLALESRTSPKVMVGVSGSYTPDMAEDDEGRTVWNSPSMGFNVYGEYSATDAAKLGVGFAYSRTPETTGKEEINGKMQDLKMGETDTTITATAAFEL